MMLAAKIITAFVALTHIYILWMEMFAWTTKGRKVFKNFPQDLFEPTKQMAANQGLYNGFLASGLIWSILINDSVWSGNVALFFLGCVFVAGLYGAISVTKKIFYIQSVPAFIGIVLWSIIKFSL
ncbi:DUF1304 domain-containing protein [Maribacter arcticus]|uniref:Putative membrane protein n=2 Tax=Maribacter arcticus TaxID=561365 RepID=A0A1T5AD34_9FLAO|nr:DUF1304 domain-containing protein [Maribacter arcticus]SKB32840.1 putative membrane protein [Maribacter arcticus]